MNEQEEQEWQERLRAAVEKTLREREAKRAERAEFARRRTYGLAQRHAAKLNRLKEKTMTDTSQYDRIERIAMSHGLHVQRVDLYQVINVKGEVILGTNPMTLDDLESTFGGVFNQLDRLAKAQAVIDAKVEAGELERLPGGKVKPIVKQPVGQE